MNICNWYRWLSIARSKCALSVIFVPKPSMRGLKSPRIILPKLTTERCNCTLRFRTTPTEGFRWMLPPLKLTISVTRSMWHFVCCWDLWIEWTWSWNSCDEELLVHDEANRSEDLLVYLNPRRLLKWIRRKILGWSEFIMYLIHSNLVVIHFAFGFIWIIQYAIFYFLDYYRWNIHLTSLLIACTRWIHSHVTISTLQINETRSWSTFLLWIFGWNIHLASLLIACTRWIHSHVIISMLQINETWFGWYVVGLTNATWIFNCLRPPTGRLLLRSTRLGCDGVLAGSTPPLLWPWL